LKRAVIGGLNLAGVSVQDAELATVPLTRFQVRNGQARGGITVRLAPGDPDEVEMRFFDADGRDIDESMQRRVERLLYREDYRRAFAADIGDIEYPPRSLEFYTSALMHTVDSERLVEHAFKVVLDYSYGAASIVMPTVLAKTGAEVLAVNPYASTSSATAALEEYSARVARLSDLVRSSGSHLGIVMDPDGETATMIDDEGHPLTNDQALLALMSLVTEAKPGARVALPVAVSRVAEQIAEANGATITWTKLSAPHLMEVASTGEIDFAAAQDGGFIWPDFMPAFDATATLVKLLDLLASTGHPLSSVVKQLPRLHMAHESVPTPWERKGAVMREMVERAGTRDVVLVDGVKVVRPDGWALVLPDPEEAVTHVWAEGESDQAARQLAQEYARRIRQVLR
jgi:mannose-1-phosphate guanylyltransferase/phosphomannomutase